MLDRALFRRFDGVIEYSLPTSAVTEQVMRARLGLLDTTEIDWARVALRAEGLSHAEIVMACDQAAKNAILEHRTVVLEAELAHALEERRDGPA